MKYNYPIVKPILPDKSKYYDLIDSSFKRNWLTNNGPLLQELEQKLADYFGVKHLMLVANGTLALHLAYRVLGVQGKVNTTPFSFAATASSLAWEKHTINFCDIDKHSLNIDVNKLDKNANAIVGVHVFGNPCEVEAIDEFAKTHSQKVIYDAAHAFGSNYKSNSLLQYGDASTLSLHATKIFHCVEGGAIVFKKKEHLEKAKQLINFGFDENNIPTEIGVNAKMSEMHAAMGLALFDQIDDILDKRQHLVAEYQKQLNGVVEFQQWHQAGTNNGAYMPILLKSEEELLKVQNYLSEQGIQTRRYFYPSLSDVGIYANTQTVISKNISSKVLCLPLYYQLLKQDVIVISSIIKNIINKTV